MTTSAAAGAFRTWDSRTDRKVYLVWMACIWAAMALGFSLDIARYMGERPAPPLILHLHGALYVAWLCLVTVQILLVEGGRVRLHKQLGWWTAGVSALMVPMGVVAALVDKARLFGRPDADLPFLGLEFEDMIGFAILITAGLLWRKDLAAHKRLMILAAVSVSDAGFGRAWQMGIKVAPPGPLGWWVQYYWGIPIMIVAILAWDFWKRRRVHPAVLFGAVVLLAGETVSTILYFSPAWARSMTALVQAWGYKG